MIELEGVTKRFGEKVAVADLSLQVEKGEILGLLGPNGAGKTTTMRIITGYLPPTTGRVRVAGREVPADPVAAKKMIGYLPENPPLYGELTVEEQLNFVAEIKGIAREQRQAEIHVVMEETGSADVSRRLVGNLSRGYKQRVGLAQALLGNPQILILDEPTVGLDPRQIIEIRSLIRQLAGSRTVILSSHILPEVSQLCQRVAIINQGRLVAQDTPARLAQSLGRVQRLQAEIRGPVAAVREKISAVQGVQLVTAERQLDGDLSAYAIELDGTADHYQVREAIFRVLAAAGWPLMAMQVEQLSLEDIFLQLVVEEEE